MFFIQNKSPTPAAAPVAAAPLLSLGAILVLALGTFAVGTDAFIVAAFLPLMADDLGVTPAVAGHSVTAFALAYAVLAPLIATASARVPRRAMLVAALAMLGLANIGSALAPSMSWLIATRVAAAAAAAAYTPSAGAVAAALVRPDFRARALAIVIGGLTLATALGVPLGRLASTLAGWRAALVAVGVVSFVAAAGVRATLPRLGPAPAMPLAERLQALRQPAVLKVLPLTVLGMAACYVPYAYTVQVLQALGTPAGAVTGMLLAYGLGAMAGNYASGAGTDRRGARAVLLATYLAMAAALGGLAWLTTASHPTPWAVALLMGLWGASSWAQSPAQQHRLIEAAPRHGPLVVALNASGIYFGIALGTAVSGRLIDTGATAALACGLALALASWLYAALTSRPGTAPGRHGMASKRSPS